MEPGAPHRATLAAYVALVVLAGSNSVAVWYSNAELAPFWGATLRFAAAGALFLAFALLAGRPFPRGRGLLGTSLYGALGFGGFYAFAYVGILHVPPGTAQVILALVPLLTLLLGALHRQEPFRWRGLAGALLATAGVAVVFWQQLTLDVPLVGPLALVGAAACFAEAALVIRRFPRTDIVTTNAVAMAIGALLLLFLSLLAGEQRAVPREPATWMALAYLIVAGSVAAFALTLFVLHRWSANAASYQFVLFPFVALTVSAWLTGERLTGTLALGAALVLAGVYLGALWGAPLRGRG